MAKFLVSDAKSILSAIEAKFSKVKVVEAHRIWIIQEMRGIVKQVESERKVDMVYQEKLRVCKYFLEGFEKAEPARHIELMASAFMLAGARLSTEAIKRARLNVEIANARILEETKGLVVN